MKRNAWWLLFGVCALGLVCGYAARHAASGTSEAAAGQTMATSDASPSAPSRSGPFRGAGPRAIKSTLRSSDTLESIIQLGTDVPYEQLSLWLLDADADDISAYWAAHKGRKNQDRDVTDLIMISRTRVDPVGAVTAEQGTKYENFAWWAWASHDPRAALDAVQSMSPDFTSNVAWGIGEFHPAWLREHMDQIPASGRINA